MLLVPKALGLFIAAISLQAQEKAVPVFKNGEAQIVKAFEDPDSWIRHDLWVETTFDTDGDGKIDRMHVAVTRPCQTESEGLQLPVIYISSPYFAGTAGHSSDYFWDVHHEIGEEPPPYTHPPEIKRRGRRPIISNSHTKTWIPRGYIVVHSSAPGTGLSDGSPTLGGENEALATKAVIDWLCGRAKGYRSREGNEELTAYWSTGKVGMTGTSYNGTLTLAAATTGVEGLEAIIPVAPNTSYYQYYRSHGLVRSPGGFVGEDIDVLFDFIHSGEEGKRDFARDSIRNGVMKQKDRITGDYNDFWAGRDYLNHLGPMKAALFMAHGFNDWNVMPEHSLRIYEAVREKGLPAMIYYHQNGHGGPPPVSMMNRWFTRYLHGIENGVENGPRAWIVREGDDPDKPTAYPDYPHPEAKNVCLYLKSGGPVKGRLLNTKPSVQGQEKLIDDSSVPAEDLARTNSSNHRLLYLSRVLKQELHISGRARITIRAASSKPAVNLSVYLVSLPWKRGLRSKITDNIITRGWADLQNHRSLTESAALEPGHFYEMSFDLQPDDQVIPAGQQIGLMIFSSDRDFTLRPKPGTELSVDLDGTRLELPVVGGAQAWRSAF